MKKIEAQERNQQEQAPAMKLAGKSEVISSKSWYAVLSSLSFIEAKQSYSRTTVGDPVDQPSSFFHPPGA